MGPFDEPDDNVDVSCLMDRGREELRGPAATAGRDRGSAATASGSASGPPHPLQWRAGMTLDEYQQWMYTVRAAYIKLRDRGQGRSARRTLRERFRQCGAGAQTSAHHTLAALLDESESLPDSMGLAEECSRSE